MKTFFAVVAFIAVPTVSSASNYPPDYFHQIVRAKHDGAVLFAHVGSGCNSHEVVGYKGWGKLAASNPESIDAVIKGTCQKDGNTYSKISVLVLGKEWHGNGYLSNQFETWNLQPSECWGSRDVELSFAFSANGQWDSLDGANYVLPNWFAPSNEIKMYNTKEGNCTSVNFKAWDFIVSEMSK